MVALPAPGNETFRAEDAQTLRDRGKLLLGGGDDLGDAQLPFLEQFQDAQAWRIPHGPEQLGRTLQRSRRNKGLGFLVIAGFTGWGRLLDGTPLFQYFIVSYNSKL
jgi:hypothetical protein